MLRKLKRLVQNVKDFAITGKEKAAAAGVYSAVVAYLAENNLHVQDLWNWKTLWALLIGVVGHQVTYWLSNSGNYER